MSGEKKPAGWRSEVIDVSGLSLTELAELTQSDHTGLAWTLRRLADDLTDPDEPIAGFNSAL